MDIREEKGSDSGAYYMEEGGKRIAEMTYSLKGGRTMCILHTGVDSAWEGKGLGKALVEHALERARAEGLEVDPRCPFAKRIMERLNG